MCDIDNYMCDRGSLIRVFMSSPQRYSLQGMLAISACFIAANAYNFGAIRCGKCLQFRRDSLQRNSTESLLRMLGLLA